MHYSVATYLNVTDVTYSDILYIHDIHIVHLHNGKNMYYLGQKGNVSVVCCNFNIIFLYVINVHN